MDTVYTVVPICLASTRSHCKRWAHIKIDLGIVVKREGGLEVGEKEK